MLCYRNYCVSRESRYSNGLHYLPKNEGKSPYQRTRISHPIYFSHFRRCKPSHPPPSSLFLVTLPSSCIRCYSFSVCCSCFLARVKFPGPRKRSQLWVVPVYEPSICLGAFDPRSTYLRRYCGSSNPLQASRAFLFPQQYREGNEWICKLIISGWYFSLES